MRYLPRMYFAKSLTLFYLPFNFFMHDTMTPSFQKTPPPPPPTHSNVFLFISCPILKSATISFHYDEQLFYFHAKRVLFSESPNRTFRTPHQKVYINVLMYRKWHVSGVRPALQEAVSGVTRLAIKGEKILLTTDKTRKKSPTSDKKLIEIYPQLIMTKVKNFNRQPTKQPPFRPS